MKPPKQQQPKKSNLSAEMGNRIKQLSDARLEKQRVDIQQRFMQQEDEQMAMIYGPNWRDNDPQVPVVTKAPEDDEFDNEYYDDHPQRRKAS